MFAGEIVAGMAAGSRALQADALDFLGDAANYAISLGVAGMALRWRSRAALLKGGTILAALGGTVPHAATMGIVGIIALVANGGVALMLYRFRSGDANRRWSGSARAMMRSAILRYFLRRLAWWERALPGRTLQLP